MGEPEATLQELLGQAAQAQLVLEPLSDNKEGNGSGHLEVVEGRADALAEGALAGGHRSWR